MEAVIDGTYTPLARPIFIYVNAKSLDKPEVKEFVEYYMKHGAKLAKEVKYVPLPRLGLQDRPGARAQGKLGTVFGGDAEVGVTIEELLQARSASCKRDSAARPAKPRAAASLPAS